MITAAQPLIATGINQRYASTTGMVMSREQGKTPNGNDLGGRWVLRDSAGALVDFDQYRHDLAERHGLTLVS